MSDILHGAALLKGGAALAAAARCWTGAAGLRQAWAQTRSGSRSRAPRSRVLRWKRFVAGRRRSPHEDRQEVLREDRHQDERLTTNPGKTSSPRRRSRPTPARGPTSILGTLRRCRFCSRPSASTSPTSPTISARNTAAGTRLPSTTASQRQQVDRHSRRRHRRLRELPQSPR